MKPIFTVPIILFFLTSCFASDDRGYMSSRKEHMSELRLLLEQRNIPYKMNNYGYIIYSREFENEFNQARQIVEESFNSEIGLMVENDKELNFFVNLLKENDVVYRLKKGPNNTWVYWRPLNDKIKDALEVRYINFLAKNR